MLQFAARAPDKERFVAALRRQPRADVPFFEYEIAPAIVSRILGRPITQRSYDLPPQQYIELLTALGIDVAYLGVAWNVGRESRTTVSGVLYYVDGFVTRSDQLAALRPPDLGPIRRRIEEFLDSASGTSIGWIYALPTAEDVSYAMGLDRYYTAMYEEPEFIDSFMDIYGDYAKRVTSLVLSYRPDAVMCAAGLCGKSGLLIRHEHAERFVLSRLRRQMRIIVESKVPAIIHSDGDNSAVIGSFVEMGFSAMHPVEPCKSFDIYQLKREWGGRISLVGNINVAGVLSQGSPEEVAEDTLEHLERLSVGGGYIVGSSHDITENVPLENLHAMIKTVCDFQALG